MALNFLVIIGFHVVFVFRTYFLAVVGSLLVQ